MVPDQPNSKTVALIGPVVLLYFVCSLDLPHAVSKELVMKYHVVNVFVVAHAFASGFVDGIVGFLALEVPVPNFFAG